MECFHIRRKKKRKDGMYTIGKRKKSSCNDMMAQTVIFRNSKCTMGDQKMAARMEKSVFLVSLYLFNYSSNFKIVKSLTQLDKWAI
jgi:hypothetical protein